MSPVLVPMAGLPGCRLRMIPESEHVGVDSLSEREIVYLGRSIGRIFYRRRTVANGSQYGWYTARCRQPRTMTEAARVLLQRDGSG